MSGLSYETPLWAQGLVVAGIDEVGRGPLAGPVVAACVALSPQSLVAGIDDSKRLSPKKRAALALEIQEKALAFGIGQVEAEEIDREGILPSVRKAMRLAAEAVCAALPRMDCLLVDGNDRGLLLPAPHTMIVKGDQLSDSIGAASIVAKEYRDALMTSYARQYPNYGFEGHKGYGSAAHMAAIRAYGPCPLHRRSFITRIWTEGSGI